MTHVHHSDRPLPTSSSEFKAQRESMVKHQIAARGVQAANVLTAMRDVPREAFVAAELIDRAYADAPLPIGDGQTISQPFIVALMVAALQLKGGERVLDIGTGSGYAAAVIGQIAAEVYTVERLAGLVNAAQQRFQRLHYDNIHCHHGDGSIGWAEHAPYDAIVVGAAGPEVPPILREQLALHGHLVMPVGADRHLQELVCEIRLGEDRFKREVLESVRFVPLIGAAAW